MARTSAKRRWWADRRCDTTGLASISFLRRGEPDTVAKVLVQPEVVEIWEAMETVLIELSYGDADIVGSIRHCPFGIGGKTCEESGKNCSLHNYCLALDVDPWAAGNPHFRKPWPLWSWSKVKFTKQQVLAVERIRMLDGSKPLRWLGWAIGDTMHWEIDIPPASAESGVDWSTVGLAPPPPPPEDEDMSIWMGSLQRQTPAYFEALAAQTGSPGGSDPGYWGRSHDTKGNRVKSAPDDTEWDDAVDELAAAAVKVGVMAKGGPSLPDLDDRYAAKEHPHTASTTIN